MGYFDSLLRYFEFSGRTTRGQYWMFQLCYLVVMGAAAYGDLKLTGHGFDEGHIGLLVAFALIFHIVPIVTVSVRRLHDIGRSGWWFLLNFVPFGGLLIFVWSFYGSEPGANAYGDDPHSGVQTARPPERRGRSSPAGDAAAAMLARMAERRGSARLAP